MVNVKANRDFRPILIPNKAFDALKEAKEITAEQAKNGGKNDLSMAISSMGTGAFAGLIIIRFLDEIK